MTVKTEIPTEPVESNFYIPNEAPNLYRVLSDAISATDASNDSFLRTAAAAESRGESSVELQAVLDTIVGIKLMGIRAGDEDIVQGAETIFVQALTGDEKSRGLAEEGLAAMQAHNPGGARKNMHREYLREELGITEEEVDKIYSLPESLEYKYLSIVHATDHRPTRNKSGTKRIDERFTSSGHARSTVHVALNAQVESHVFSADWSSRKFIIVAPMDEVVDRNGEPSSLIGHDTWWEVSPGHGLELPDSTIVIAPGASKAVQYFPESKEVRYKNQGIIQRDIDELTQQASDYELSLLSSILGVKLHLSYNHQSSRKFGDTSMDQYETVLTEVQRTEITKCLKECVESDPERGVAAFTDLAKRVAVRIALEAQGREVIEPRTIMESSFMSPDLDEELRRLSLKHDANAGHHSESTVGRLEELLISTVDRGKFIGNRYERRYIAQEIRENTAFIGRGTLQMCYRLGLI